MNTPTLDKDFAKLFSFKKTPVGKHKVNSNSARKLERDQTDINKKPTRDILMFLYERHSVGVWMTISAAAVIWGIMSNF